MRMWMAGILVVVLAAVCCAQPGGGAASGGVFDLGSVRPQRAVVTVGAEMPELHDGDSVMLRTLRGVLAELKGKSLEDLRATVPASPFLGDAGSGPPVCVVHLSVKDAKRGEVTKRVAVHRGPGGQYVAVELDAADGRPRRAELKREAFAAVSAGWPQYRGGYGATEEKAGEVVEMAKPYEPGRFVVDENTLNERFANGGKSVVPPSERVLEQEKLFVRLPRGYDPRRPAGVLIWTDPGSEGRLPREAEPALDDLNLIAVVAANAGNSRPVAERYQLAFDGLATVSRRWHVDPRRVYLSGVSGGGRVSSILQGCFPDVFAGAVPIVGISCYQPVPNGVGGWWKGAYIKPGSDRFNRLKTRRMAAVTGLKDPNQIQTQHTVDIMRRDGIGVRLFDYPDMGHTMATTERFGEALAWVDEPYRGMRQAEEDAAGKALEAYLARHVAGPPRDEAARKMLVKVTEAGPWTEAGWRAAEWLGAAPARAEEPVRP